MSIFNFSIQTFLLTVPGIIIGLAFHEFAHAWTADKLGDPTPRNMGKITLNPLAHLDPIGTIMILLVQFGWSKPIVTNPSYYKNPKRDDIIVTAAGPLMNLLIAIFFTLVLKIYYMIYPLLSISSDFHSNLQYLIIYTIQINVVLFVLNILPIPLLDGYHILTNLINIRYYRFLAQIEQYSFIILILLMFSGVLSIIIGIPARIITNFLLNLVV